MHNFCWITIARLSVLTLLTAFPFVACRPSQNDTPSISNDAISETTSLNDLDVSANEDMDNGDEDATVEGLDIDKNGVRDDLQRYIDTTYPGSENVLLRQALTEIAKSSQQVLLSVQADDEFVVVSNILIDLDNRQCLYGLFGETAFEYADKLLFEILDTDARINLDIQADVIFGGEIYTPRRDALSACNFDVSGTNSSP
ncbi:MAG: hypothetical protein AAF267_03380 [Deinococcota bacterium]